TQDFAGDEPVPLDICMDTVAGEHEIWIGATVLGEEKVHRTVRIDHFPSLRALSQQPLRIAVEHFVVALVRRSVFRKAGGKRAALERHRIECRWRDMNDLRARCRSAFAQAPYAVLESLKAFIAERIINSVVHPVAGDDQ